MYMYEGSKEYEGIMNGDHPEAAFKMPVIVSPLWFCSRRINLTRESSNVKEGYEVKLFQNIAAQKRYLYLQNLAFQRIAFMSFALPIGRMCLSFSYQLRSLLFSESFEASPHEKWKRCHFFIKKCDETWLFQCQKRYGGVSLKRLFFNSL